MNNRNKRLNNLNKIPDIAGMDHRFFLNESGNLVSHEGMTRNQRRLLRIEAKKIFAQYISICKKIQSSGVGFPVDKIIRSMALEYTNRYASSGINNQPISFNYFEPFCEIKLIKDSFAPYASILPEVNHLFSSSDFFDFLTSNDSAGFELSDLLNIPESRTFNFTNNGNIDELSFFDASGREYVISGFSIVRRGNSVHWFLVAGEQLTSEEWEILSEDVPNIDIKYVTPWKRLFLEECIKSSDGTIGKPIKLDGTEFSIRRGFLTLEAISGHFVEFSHPTGARSGILTIFCFWRRVLNAVRVSRPEKAVLVEAMWSVHCLFLQMACRSLRNRA
ncbi:hypothetical protein AB2M16_14045 [Acetobacter oryzifermentans]|uniref:hypothetical protein n=1 Tax=Acetobacter oryzifermentans TaxID=1633874 RepID=UPI003463EB47